MSTNTNRSQRRKNNEEMEIEEEQEEDEEDISSDDEASSNHDTLHAMKESWQRRMDLLSSKESQLYVDFTTSRAVTAVHNLDVNAKGSLAAQVMGGSEEEAIIRSRRSSVKEAEKLVSLMNRVRIAYGLPSFSDCCCLC